MRCSRGYVHDHQDTTSALIQPLVELLLGVRLTRLVEPQQDSPHLTPTPPVQLPPHLDYDQAPASRPHTER